MSSINLTKTSLFFECRKEEPAGVLGGVGRSWEELGGVRKSWEKLGGFGRGKEELGGIGRSWRSQEGERRTVVTSTSLSPTQDTAVLLETANYRAVLLYS